jgi:DNA-directed RNA polymerase specialized sigma24 family protein
MRDKSQLLEIEVEFNAILEKYGAFLSHTIARVCPKDLGIQFDDMEQGARLRLWRAIESEREINFHGSYIYKIVMSVTINAIRRAKARREEQLRLAGDDEDEGSAEVNLTIARRTIPAGRYLIKLYGLRDGKQQPVADYPVLIVYR